MNAQLKRLLAGRFMTKLLATLALAVGFTTAATAADPVAVWDGGSGDFTAFGATKNGYALSLNENTVADGVVTMTAGKKGLKIAWPSGTNPFGTDGNKTFIQVLVRYSDLTAPTEDNKGRVMVSLSNSVGGNSDYLGSCVNKDGATRGIWGGTSGANRIYANKASGTMASPVVSGKANFVCSYTRNSPAGVNAYVDGAQAYGNDGLKAGYTVQDIYVGGSADASDGNFAVCEGMKIYGIAVFTNALTAAEMAAYRFASESKELQDSRVVAWNQDLAQGSVKQTAISGNSLKMSIYDDETVATVTDGKVTLVKQAGGKASTGVAIAHDDASAMFDSADMTVFVKYSGLSLTTANTAFFSTYWGTDQSKEVVVNGNTTSMRLAKNVTTSASGNNGTAATNSVVPAAGVMMVTMTKTGKIRVAFSPLVNNAYGAFDEKMVSGDNFVAANSKFYGITVGGTHAAIGSYYRPDMVVEGVAIFDKAYTAADVQPSQIDYVFGAASEVISLNIAGGHDSAGDSSSDYVVTGDAANGLAPTAGSTWNNYTKRWKGVATKSFGPLTAAQNGGIAVPRPDVYATIRANNTYHWSTATAAFLKGYADDGGDHAQVTVSKIPYTTYDVIVYCATDTASKKFSPVKVNSVDYTYDSDNPETAKVATAATETWGASQNTTAAYGTNALRIRNQTSATLTVVGGANANGARGGVAAIQIVNTGTVLRELCDATEFTVSSEADWTGCAVPTSARTAAVTEQKTAFGGNTDYLRATAADKSATVVNVGSSIDAAYIYGLVANNGNNGGGAVNRDVYLKVSAGNVHLISGGEDANYGTNTKTIPTGNLLTQVSGSTSVDYVFGAGRGGGSGGVLANVKGNVGVTIDGNATVRGSAAAGWSSAHNAQPKVEGNTSLLVKNVQGTTGAVSPQNNTPNGYLVGGSIFETNMGGGEITGNTSVTVDLPDGATGTFSKTIVGGSLKDNNDGKAMTVAGNSSVTVTAPAGVTFSGSLIGGGQVKKNCTCSVGGNSSVTINGGKFSGAIYAGGYGNTAATVGGTATITVNGGTFTGAFNPGNATGTKTLALNTDLTLTPAQIAAGFDALTVAAEKTLTLNATADVTFAFPTSSSGAVVKTGAGALKLGEQRGVGATIAINEGTVAFTLTEDEIANKTTFACFKSEAEAADLAGKVTAFTAEGRPVAGTLGKTDGMITFTPVIEFYTLEVAAGSTVNWSDSIWTRDGESDQPYAPAAGACGMATITVGGDATIALPTSAVSTLSRFNIVLKGGVESATVTFAYAVPAEMPEQGVAKRLDWPLITPISAEDVTLAYSLTGDVPEGYLSFANGTGYFIAKKSNSISIKFGPRGASTGRIAPDDSSVGGYPVVGTFWNHSKNWNNNDAGTTEVFALKDGNNATLDGVLCYYYTPNTYFDGNGNAQTTGNGKLTKTYFDDTDRMTPVAWPYPVTNIVGVVTNVYYLPETPTKEDVTANLRWEVAITNIPYQVFDLYIYQASDLTGTINLLPIAVKANDGEWKYFAGDNQGSTVAATYDATWTGAPYCDQATMTEGTHYIRYRLSKAALGLGDDDTISVIYLSHPKKHDGARLGLAGVQIVAVENDGYYTRNAGAGTASWTAAGSWLNSSKLPTTWQNPSGKDVAYATIDGDSVSTIDIDGEIVANNITLVNTAPAEGEKTFTFTASAGGTLASPIDATGFHGRVVPCEGMTGAISLGTDAYVEVNIAAGETVAIADILPHGVTLVGTPLRITGEGTVVCDGAYPSDYRTQFQNADAWHGTVWLKNVNMDGSHADTQLKAYGNASSFVKVTGVQGWMNSGDQSVANLVLADEGDTLAFENDDTSKNYTYKYAKLTGSGSFKFATVATTAAGVAIADVSDFTGALLSTAGLHHNGTSATTARPIYVGTTTATAGTASLISVADGATVNSGCGWQAASVAFGSTLVVKGMVGDTLVTGVTTAPTLDTAVTLKDRTTLETVEGPHCLAYDAATGAVKVFKYVTFELTTVAGAESVTVNGGTLTEGTVKAYVGQTLTLTYTANEGKLFNDGAATKTVTVASVTTGEAAKSVVDSALEGVTTADAKAKIGTQLYLTFAAAVDAANEAAPTATTVEPLVDATVDAAMSVSNTVSFKIATGLTLTLEKGDFKASQFVNNGTIHVIGGTAEAPIELTGNGDFGVMTLAADTYVKNTVDNNRKHQVTGVGLTSKYALTGSGFSDGSAFANLTIVSAATGNGVWIERGIGENVGLEVPAGYAAMIGNDSTTYQPTFIVLSGAGEINAKHSSSVVIACATPCEYAGTSSVPFTVGGTETLTLSGAYTGALTVNADAQVVLAVPADATKTISGTVSGAGDIATTGTGTLVLSGDASSFTGVLTVASGLTVRAGESWLTDGKLKFEDASCALVLFDQTSFDGSVEIELADASAQPGSVSVTSATAPEHDFGTVTVTGTLPNLTVKYTPWVSGKGAKYAWEFDGSLASTGRDTSSMGKDHGPYYTDDNTGIYAYSQPYSGLTWPTEFTTAIACTLPTNANVCLVGWGQASPGGIALISGDVTKNEVKMVYWQANQAYTVLKTMTVPNAYDCEHLYLFSKTADGVKVYLDGSLVVNYSGALSIGVGVQVGTVYQGVGNTGIVRLDNVYSSTNTCKAVINSLRVYDTVLGPNAIAELKKEFPYTSPNGTYSRALTGTENTWNEAAAWTKSKEGEPETQVAVPGENATVELSAAADAAVANNLEAAAVYEAVNLSGEGAITISANAANANKITTSALKVGASAVIEYSAMDLANTPIEITTGKTLTIDATMIDVSRFYADATIILTGLVTVDDEVAQFIVRKPAAVDGRTVTVEKNEATGQYELKVTVAGPLTAEVSGAATFSTLTWKMGETTVIPDWTIAKAAKIIAGSDASVDFGAAALEGVVFTVTGDNAITFTGNTSATLDFGATRLANLNGSYAHATDGTVTASGSFKHAAGTLKLRNSTVTALAFAAGTAIELYGENGITNATVAGDVDWTVKTGTTTFGFNLEGNHNLIKGANIVIDAGATLVAQTINANWGYRGLTINGTLRATKFTRPLPGAAVISSETGVLEVGTIGYGNGSQYTFALNEVRLGEGGIVNDNNNGTTFVGFRNTTVKATAGWSTACALEISGPVTFDTNGFDVNLNAGLRPSATNQLTKAGVGTLTIGNDAAVSALVMNGGTVSLAAGKTLTAASLTVAGGALANAGTITGVARLEGVDFTAAGVGVVAFGDTVDVYGNVKLSKDAAIALNGKTINVKAGARLDVNGKIGRMPDATINVEEGGTLINYKLPPTLLIIR